MNTDSQWSKQETCFACATHVWLAVIHNTSFTSGESARYSKRITLEVSLATVNHICVIHEAMNGCKKSKGSFKDCFAKINIII